MKNQLKKTGEFLNDLVDTSIEAFKGGVEFRAQAIKDAVEEGWFKYVLLGTGAVGSALLTRGLVQEDNYLAGVGGGMLVMDALYASIIYLPMWYRNRKPKVVQWQHESWRYIDRGRTPSYDGSFLVRRTDEETAAVLPTLIDLVREGHVHAIKYISEADHSAAGFSDLKPPILFYCKEKERDRVKQALDESGFSDAEWRRDERGSFRLAKWGVDE